MIVAVRQALDDTSTVRAIAVCVLGWTLAIALAIVLSLLVGSHVSSCGAFGRITCCPSPPPKS